MRAAVVDEHGVLSARRERPTPSSGGLEPLFELLREYGTDKVEHAVIGVPGRVDYRAGVLSSAPNLPAGWKEGLTATKIGRAVGGRVSLANDADLAAVGEAWYGAGRGRCDLVYVTLSTGIGAGVVSNGLVWHGRYSIAELGHTVVDLRALPHGASTVEELGSGSALRRRAVTSGLRDIDGPTIEQYRIAGDPVATEIWDATVYAAAVGVTNMAWLFSPELVVVGGGLGLSVSATIEGLRSVVVQYGPEYEIDIVKAELGDDAALVGAAAWQRAFVPKG